MMTDFDGFYILSLLLPLPLLGLLIFLYKKRLSPESKKKPFFIAWNLVACFLLLSVVFLIGESYFRLFIDTTDSFALNKVTQRWGKRHYQFNNLRARDNLDYDLLVAPAKRRITFIGDSFTAGHGIVDVDDRFANLIRSENPEWEVHVMAANGLETIDEFELTQKLVTVDKYQFDLVVLIYNLNDISYLLFETQKIYDRVYSFEKELNYFGRNSYLINTLWFRWFAIKDPDIRDYYNFVKDGYFSAEWQRHSDILSRLNNYVKQQGCKLLVVTFPFLHKLGNYDFKDVHTKLTSFWKSLDVPQLDLFEEYAKYGGEKLVVNAFDAHPNERAHGIAAKVIEKFIRENL